MIPLNIHFVNVQPCRRRCTVSNDGTVQFAATRVFSFQRRYCSTRAAEVFNAADIFNIVGRTGIKYVSDILEATNEWLLYDILRF